VSVVLLDTGPLVGYINKTDQYHLWAVEQFKALHERVLTCEAVWTEAAFLTVKGGGTADSLWPMLRSSAVQLDFNLMREFESVAALMNRYTDLPMTLADACLVRMSELNPGCQVLTTDSHFKIYRRFGRQTIPLFYPN
jgi:predicted nucleic acid-binding protein